MTAALRSLGTRLRASTYGYAGELVVVAMLLGAVYSDLSRFQGPVQERYVPNIVQPGGIDFASPYLATLAYLRGANPYRHEIPELKDPIGRDRDVFNGNRYDFVYGPAHLLFFAPLTLATGGSRYLGHRVWFHLNLLWCAALAAITVAIANRLRPAARVPLSVGVLFGATLALAPAQNMLLERGQSDLFIALLTWCGVWLALRGRFALAVALTLVSVMMKPYAVPLLAGLILFGVLENARRAVALGLATGAVFLLPVWHLVPISLRASFDRGPFFVEHWTSNSFVRLFRWLDVPNPELARWAAMALGVLACAALAWRYLGATRDPSPVSVLLRQRLLVTFATAGLAFSLGASNASAFYNLGLIMPGLLALGLTEHPRSGAPVWRSRLAWVFLVYACLVTFWDVPQQADPFPTPALGFLALFGFAGLRAIEATARQAH